MTLGSASVAGEHICKAGLESGFQYSWKQKNAGERNKVFWKKMAALVSRRRVDRWAVSPELVPVKTFSAHLPHFLEIVYNDVMLFKKCRHIPLFQFPEKQRGHLYSMVVETLLAIYISSESDDNEVNNSSPSRCSGFARLSDNWKRRDGRVLLWHSGLCKPDQGAAKDKEAWRRGWK